VGCFNRGPEKAVSLGRGRALPAPALNKGLRTKKPLVIKAPGASKTPGPFPLNLGTPTGGARGAPPGGEKPRKGHPLGGAKKTLGVV